MKRVDIIRRAGRNLRQAKGRTILTSLAIAVGAFTLTMALAAGQGTRDYSEKLLKTNIDPHAVFVVKDKALFAQGGETGLREYDPDVSASASGRPGATLKQMNEDDVKYLQSRDDLKDIVPVYQLTPKWIVFEPVDKKFIGNVDYFDSTVLTEAKAGNVPQLGEQIADDEIVVPQDYADKIGISADQLIGKKVTVTFVQQSAKVDEASIRQAFSQGGSDAVQQLMNPTERDYTFRIRAVTKKSVLALAATSKLLISVNASRTANDFQNAGGQNAGKYMGVSALARAGKDAEKVKAELEQKGYGVQTAKDAQKMLFTISTTLLGIVGGFGMLALFASIFGVINTQYISVLERTSQIGLMKALGMPRRAIAKLFRYEAAWIGLLGGAIGSSVAVLLGTSLNPWISKMIEIGDNHILVFVWWQIALLIAALILVTIIAGWFPARKAARLDPIEALRTE